MKKSKIGIIILIIVIVVSVGTFLGVSYYLDKDLEKQEQELQNTKEEYGTVNEENVATLVAKFNTEVMDNGPQYPASDDYSVAENGVYWYALYEDINLYIEPLNYTGDKEADIVDITAIHFPKDSEHANIALELAKNLIKANNSELTNEEINQLIAQAKEASKDKLVANNGKGITVALAENETTYEYQVVRIYNENE